MLTRRYSRLIPRVVIPGLLALIAACTVLFVVRASTATAAPAMDPVPVPRIILPLMKSSSQFSVYTITNLTLNAVVIPQAFYSGVYPNGAPVGMYTDNIPAGSSAIHGLAFMPQIPLPAVFEGYVEISTDQLSGVTATVATWYYPPRLTMVTPNIVPADRASTLIITGTSFAPTPAVRLGQAISLSVNYISPNALTATVPAGLVSGWYTLTVINPTGQSASLGYMLRVDGIGPVAVACLVNGGALDTAALTVTLSLSATDASDDSSLLEMSFSNDASAWSPWTYFASPAEWPLAPGNGPKTVYARLRDPAGNVSSSVSDTINLDTTAGTEYGISINDAALFTNDTAVRLTLGSRPGAAQMQVSNDGGFGAAAWEPYSTHKGWTITQYMSYTIPRVVYARFKDVGGAVSPVYQDDIILDVTPPTGAFQILLPESDRPTHAMASPLLGATAHYTVYLPVAMSAACVDCIRVGIELTANDDLSGVGEVRISNNDAQFRGAAWQTFAAHKDWWLARVGTTTVYVQYRDNAGNTSPVYSAAVTP
jgi:hypothetical protein